MDFFDLSNKKILIIGFGISGRSAAKLLITLQAFVTAIDDKVAELEFDQEVFTLRQAGVQLLRNNELPPLNTFDLILVSPGIPPTHPIFEKAIQKNIPIAGEIELGCRLVQNPIIGITGTNGKTTVTLLTKHILEQCHFDVIALGNVGMPFTTEIINMPPDRTIVLELSSYQLETLYHKSLESAVILNITPDHLDRYRSMEEYAKAKCSIERCLKDDRELYVDEKIWKNFGYLFKEIKPKLYGYSPNSFIFSDGYSIFLGGKKGFDLPSNLQGRKSHEVENLMATYALCLGKDIDQKSFLEAYASFKKPSHRIEFVAEYRGVKFYDDSKGTNIDAVIRAVESLDGPITLIAGGVDKGSSYCSWIEGFQGKVKKICLIGQAANKIKKELELHLDIEIFPSLKEAVEQGFISAKKGETILLSPGCASFDMFKDYAHRGKEFQKIVASLRGQT